MSDSIVMHNKGFGKNCTGLTGQVFGRLTVLSEVPRSGPHGYLRKWLCRCSCGKTIEVWHANLRAGKSRSCGCLRVDAQNRSHVTHGLSLKAVYTVWKNMIKRCCDPTNNRYADYGGRGITVCERWRDSVVAFREDMGDPPAGTQIDRIDNDGPYCKENCRWATRSEEQNNRRVCHQVTFGGRTQTVRQWERELGWDKGTVTTRLTRGWSIERALTKPVHAKPSPSV